MPTKKTRQNAAQLPSPVSRLRAELTERGLSQRGFRELLAAHGYRVANATVNRQLMGESPASGEMLTAAVHALGLSPNWLMLGEGPRLAEFPASEARMSGMFSKTWADEDEWLTERLGERLADAITQAMPSGFDTKGRFEALIRLNESLKVRGITRIADRAPLLARGTRALVALDRELSVDQSNRGAYAAWADDVLAVVARHAPASEHSTSKDDA